MNFLPAALFSAMAHAFLFGPKMFCPFDWKKDTISDFKDLENEYLDCLNYSNEKIDTKLIYGIVGKINN